MVNDNERIKILFEALNILIHKQKVLDIELQKFKKELESLKKPIENIEESVVEEPVVFQESIKAPTPVAVKEENIKDYSKANEVVEEKTTFSNTINKPKKPSNIEKYIGENLISKIGIVITILGVGIGAKYSIENNLISPLTRIILGYFLGIGLLGIGFKLKKNYINYSAVLVSGAMSIMYFITYIAHDFYGLIPQLIAFLLMFAFTIFTVILAIKYDKQIIAHIGLVGAYAVPFLLSNGSGNVLFLFLYMAIINVGILVIAFKKYWKQAYYAAFVFTWLIFTSWFFSEYNNPEHFILALSFLLIFFVLFYITFLIYKLLRNEPFKQVDIVLLLSNSFIFFGIGYAILDESDMSKYLGVYTLFNAILHFIVSIIISRRKTYDRALAHLVIGMVLVFITIAFPIQFDGNWVTLLWVGQATLLFWVARSKKIIFYEKLSAALMLVSFLSIIQDWITYYDYININSLETQQTKVLLNINFLSSLLYAVAFFVSYKISEKSHYKLPLEQKSKIVKITSFLIPIILLSTIYFAFRLEIFAYYTQAFINSRLEGESYPDYNYDYLFYRTIWIINYSLLFVSALNFINFKMIKNQKLGTVAMILSCIAVIMFLTNGLLGLSDLRESYLGNATHSEVYQISFFNIVIRYVAYIFVSLAFFTLYKNIQQLTISKTLKNIFEIGFHISVLWIMSSELINWLEIAQSTQSDKLGLSILWGVYSLFLIALGIWKKKKLLRICAIVLFSITLVKLFLYDISELNTIAKTIVFVGLGILLLIISFLYNKYKHYITNENVD